ncbi:MAG: hypothetical protein K9W46_05995 [Candidatus Heimdallarchaeum endolithica]|uniref:Uncharacterized protein n=1 Tax=Candidatus Heimdallarchaeum endolithica TaxID=2876572 RepID=A0A9Y1BTF3_9ARCH|nr:MAG: hypothetical protein K9W46_05995 [Candidatus Heimdallarchaeum endolithica]
MSIFKTNFMKLIEAFLNDHGFRTEICTIYTKDVDYYQSYKRVVLCAHKGNLLLCIKAKSGETEDPFQGTEDEVEMKLQEPALKLLSCIRALSLGIDHENCSKYSDMVAVPVIINEKSSKNHPLFYYYDGETRISKTWYKRKNVVFIPWQWMKENWGDDFEQSLTDQGITVSKPVPYSVSESTLLTVRSIENILSKRRLGIMKTLHLDKSSLPPLVIQFRDRDLMFIFLVDTHDNEVKPILMDFLIHHYGPKTTTFPENTDFVVFNISSTEVEPYLKPSSIKDNFSEIGVIKTTVEGFKNLFEIATIEELFSVHKLPEIKKFDEQNLMFLSSGYFFESIYNKSKEILSQFYSSRCPFCGFDKVENSIPNTIVKNLKISIELSFENSSAFYCPKEKGGCGVGFLVVHDLIQGGIHGFHAGDIHTYKHDYNQAIEKLKEKKLKIHSFIHLDL